MRRKENYCEVFKAELISCAFLFSFSIHRARKRLAAQVGPTLSVPSGLKPRPVLSAQQTPEQLQQLVAPIALYPDALVAQILAAATYPDQVVEADRWLQQHPDLKGEQLGKEVDKQPWDPSVKALVEFPSVLANMDKNLSWTSSLGDAYVNQQKDVMDAVQVDARPRREGRQLKKHVARKSQEAGENNRDRTGRS